MSDTHLIALDKLREAVAIVVRGFGSEPDEVNAVTGNLIEANLTGHDSHGIGMLPRYAQAYLQGGLRPNAHARIELDAGSMLRIDGGTGFGQVIGREAMALGIERARVSGCCIVALGNSHHLGRIGAWAEQVAAAGFVSMHFVNVITRGIVAPHGGGDARFGTNPFCVGVPVAGSEPVILDFATSMIAQGKTRVAYNKGETVAPGCLIDDHGQPTQDPRYTVVPPYGALLPFGAHKGYGLALICELLGGALGGNKTANKDDGTQRRVLNGMLSVLIDPAALGNASIFDSETKSFLDWVRASPVREGYDSVQVAGEAERRHRAHRSANGVPVDATTWSEILQAAGSLGVDTSKVQAAAGLG